MGQRYNIKRLTADGQVTAAGVSGHLVGFLVESGAGAGVVAFKDGTAAGSILLSTDAAASIGLFVWLGEEGMVRFATDLYLDLTNCTAVTIWYE